MKVLAFAQSSGYSGGSNRSMTMVLRMLKENYHYDVSVIVPTEGPLCKILENLGIPYQVLSSHQIGGVSSYSIKNILRLIRFKIWACIDKYTAYQYVKKLNGKTFDLVYINDTNNYIGCYVARFLSIPYIWHFRSAIYPSTKYLKESKKVFHDATNIIVISDGMKSLLYKTDYMPRNRIVRVLNGVPIEFPRIISKQDKSNGFHLVECGRITQDKGHFDAIGALSVLKQRGITDVFLHIVGDIPDKNNTNYIDLLKDSIKRFGLENQVIFEGHCDDMPHFREKMNGELMCSVCEPFGRVTLEGMRSGLIVIGSNTGGTPEIIQDGVSGLLYAQGNAEDLANKIQLVYSDDQYRRKLIENALAFSETHFTPEQNVAAIEQVIRDAVNGRTF